MRFSLPLLGKLKLFKKVRKPKRKQRITKPGEPPHYAKYGLLDGKHIQSGNKISWSKHKTRRKWFPNLQWVQLYSEIMGKKIPFLVSTSVLKKIDQMAGVDR